MTAKIDIRTLAPDLAAEVHGLDLRRPAAAGPVISEAIARHGVLFLRDQTLSLDQLLAATTTLGSTLRVPFVKGMDGHPDVIAVLKEADEKRISTFGGTWHTDFSFLPEPPSFTLLYAVELPDVGRDTLCDNLYVAYEALSPGMQRLLDPLVA